MTTYRYSIFFFFNFLLFIINIGALQYKHHNYEEVTSILKTFAKNFPSKTYLYSIGKSWNNRELWVLAISDNNPDKHIPLRPEVKYVGNIHGNEVVGKELLLSLIDYMLNNSTLDANIDNLMKTMRIHIMPLLNPDGLENSNTTDCEGVTGRYNAQNFDLNRNYPDLFLNNNQTTQPETISVINWLDANDFILSATFHGGTLVVNYPWDNYPNSDGETPKKSISNDDDVFRFIAKSYSLNSPMIKTNCSTDYFPDGITNGAEWYPAVGGFQDFNYWRYGCMDLTMEVSCCKYPPASSLEEFWIGNKPALIEYLNQANTGIKGIIKFENGMPAGNVTVAFDSREPYFKSNKNGEYYRILLPGTYKLRIMFSCSIAYESTVNILSTSKLVVLNITLSDKLLTNYKNFKLNRYPVFCSKESGIDNIIPNKSESLKGKFVYIILSFFMLIFFNF